MHLTEYTNPSCFDTLAPEWNALARKCINHTLFQTVEWLGTWWRALGQGGLRVLALREAADRPLVGIAPLFFSQPDELNVLGWKEVTDYVDVLFAAGHETGCWQATLDHLDKQAWTRFNFWNVPQASPTLHIFPELARARGWNVDVTKEDVCPIIALPQKFDAYLELLDGRERRELTRKLRRAEDDEVSIYFTRDAARLDQDVSDFIALMKASRNDKDGFMTARMDQYFHAQCRCMFDAGWLELAFLEVEGARSAAYLNFRYDNKVLVYNSGLDPAKFGYLSPGQVLIAKLIEHAINTKATHFDFLQGNEEYKYKLGGKDEAVMSVKISR